MVAMAASVSGTGGVLLLAGVLTALIIHLWRRARAEMVVCRALHDVRSIQQLRTSFQEGLPRSHVAAFTGGWLVKPGHTAAHGKLLQLLRWRTVKLDRAKPWVAATGLARLRLAEADDILPVLLGESGTLDLLCKDAYIVVRFRILPRGRQTLRARLFGPRPIKLLQARSPRGASSKSPLPRKQLTRDGGKGRTVVPHDHPPVSNTGLSPTRLAKSTLRPRLSSAFLSQGEMGQLGVQRRRSFGRAPPDQGKAEGAMGAAMRWMEDAKHAQSLSSFEVRAITMEKIGRETEEHDVGKKHRLPTPRSHCSQHRLDFTEQGETRTETRRLSGDTDAAAEMLLNEALFLRLEGAVADVVVGGQTAGVKDPVSKDAVPAEVGQAVVHGDSGGPSGVLASTSANLPQRVGVAKVLSWALLPAAPRLRRTWGRRVQPGALYQH